MARRKGSKDKVQRKRQLGRALSLSPKTIPGFTKANARALYEQTGGDEAARYIVKSKGNTINSMKVAKAYVRDASLTRLVDDPNRELARINKHYFGS